MTKTIPQINIETLLEMEKEDFLDLFAKNAALVVVPKKAYEIDWDRVRTIADLKLFTKALFRQLEPDNFMFLTKEEAETTELKRFIRLVSTK